MFKKYIFGPKCPNKEIHTQSQNLGKVLIFLFGVIQFQNIFQIRPKPAFYYASNLEI